MYTKLTLSCLAVASTLTFSTWIGVPADGYGAASAAAVTTSAPTPFTIAAPVLFLPVISYPTTRGASTPMPTDAITVTLTPTATHTVTPTLTPAPPPEVIDCSSPDWANAPECLTPTETATATLPADTPAQATPTTP